MSVSSIGVLSGCSWYFFFQAEDGIRDYKVTGVQTCALPISLGSHPGALKVGLRLRDETKRYVRANVSFGATQAYTLAQALGSFSDPSYYQDRSEERRVGKECRSRWSPYH